MSDKSSSTELEHRIARLAHLNNVLRTARKINRLVIQAHDLRELLGKACRLLVDTRDYYNAFIVNVEDGQPVEPYFHAGFESDFTPMAAALGAGNLPVCAGRHDAAQDGDLRGPAGRRGFQKNGPPATEDLPYALLTAVSRSEKPECGKKDLL